MSWTCPKCKREFKSENQFHSCVVISVEDHFAKRPPRIRDLYHSLMEAVTDFGPMKTEAVKNAIMVKNGPTFLAIKPRKDHIIVEFALDRPVDEFPVYKVMQYSKSKWAHYLKLDDQADIDELLLGWLREAYDLEAGDAT